MNVNALGRRTCRYTHEPLFPFVLVIVLSFRRVSSRQPHTPWLARPVFWWLEGRLPRLGQSRGAAWCAIYLIDGIERDGSKLLLIALFNQQKGKPAFQVPPRTHAPTSAEPWREFVPVGAPMAGAPTSS